MFGVGDRDASSSRAKALGVPLESVFIPEIHDLKGYEEDLWRERLSKATEEEAFKRGFNSLVDFLSWIDDLSKKEIEQLEVDTYLLKARNAWLKESDAIVTPLAVRAYIVSLAETQGINIHHVRANYFRENYAYPEYVTPVVPTGLIPENYGQDALEVVIFSDITEQDTYPSSDDDREGWEYGHTKAYFVSFDDEAEYGITLTTNWNEINTYDDVEAFRKGKSLFDLYAQLEAFRYELSKRAGKTIVN